MKKFHTLAAMGIALAMGATAAHAENPFDSWGAGIASESATGMTSGMALVANANKKMTNIHQNFSVQGEFTYSLSPASSEVSFFGSTQTFETTFMTLGGYGVYTHPINDKLNVYGRAGLAYKSATVETCANSSCLSASTTDTGLSYGAGVSYALKSNMNAIASWTALDSDIAHVGIGVSMGF